MANSDGYNYTENLSQIRERLARLEERIEDIAGMKTSVTVMATKVGELCEMEAGYRAKADTERGVNKWLSRVNLTAILSMAGKLLYDLFSA